MIRGVACGSRYNAMRFQWNEVFKLTEMILNARTLPEPLFRLIRTEKVKVNESGGIVSLIPIIENKSGCPLLGITAGSGLTVDHFLAMTHDETEMAK